MANKTVVEYTPSQRDAVCDYLHEQFGESENGFITHEINSEYVHTDVLRIDNEEGKVFGTFGMGVRKMRIPVPQLEDEQRAELVMYASPDMDKDGNSPVGKGSMQICSELTHLSKYPFENDTWLSAGHTINASKQFTDQFGFDFFFFYPAIYEPLELKSLGKINFLLAIPIYKAERDWMANHPGQNAEMRFMEAYLDWADESGSYAEVDVSREVIIPE